MAAQFGAGRTAPPEFGHRQGAEAVGVSILQQFGRGTFAGSGGRHALGGVGKQREQVGLLAPGVAHAEAAEQLVLQGGRARLALLLQLLDQKALGLNGDFRLAECGFPHLLFALQLRLLELTLFDEFSLQSGILGMRLTQGVAALLLGAHPLLQGLALPLNALRGLLPLFFGPAIGGILLQGLDPAVQGRDAGLLLAEEAVGLQEVVDGRHEVGMRVPSGRGCPRRRPESPRRPARPAPPARQTSCPPAARRATAFAATGSPAPAGPPPHTGGGACNGRGK